MSGRGKKIRKRETRFELLDKWADLTACIKDMAEEEALELLEAEKKGRRRPAIMLRLHMRFNKMRSIREKQALMSL